MIHLSNLGGLDRGLNIVTSGLWSVFTVNGIPYKYILNLSIANNIARRIQQKFSSVNNGQVHKDKSVSIHERNLQVFATLLYKVINNLSPEIVSEIFYANNQPHYNLRRSFNFQSVNVRTIRYGTESLTYLANKIWSQIPTDIKEAPTLELFREKIKLWQISDCPCRLCKFYIQHIGFI